MALGSNQPLVKISTRNIPRGKGGRCVRLTTSPPSCGECHEILEPKPPGTLWATPGLLQDCCNFYVAEAVLRACNSQNFTQTDGPLLCSQQLATCSYSQSRHSTPRTPPSHCSKIRCNITFPSTPGIWMLQCTE